MLVGMRAWRRGSCAMSLAMISTVNRVRSFVPGYSLRGGTSFAYSTHVKRPYAAGSPLRNVFSGSYKHKRIQIRNGEAVGGVFGESGARIRGSLHMSSASSSSAVQDIVDAGEDHEWSSSKV